MNGITIYHCHMLLQGCVHKGYSVLAELIILRDLSALLPKPLYLVLADTIPSNFAHTSPLSVFKEPDTRNFSLEILSEDRDIVS